MPSVVPSDNKEVESFMKDTKKFIDKAIGDISKSSNSKQLIFGTASGWFVHIFTLNISLFIYSNLIFSYLQVHWLYRNESG